MFPNPTGFGRGIVVMESLVGIGVGSSAVNYNWLISLIVQRLAEGQVLSELSRLQTKTGVANGMEDRNLFRFSSPPSAKLFITGTAKAFIKKTLHTPCKKTHLAISFVITAVTSD